MGDPQDPPPLSSSWTLIAPLSLLDSPALSAYNFPVPLRLVLYDIQLAHHDEHCIVVVVYAERRSNKGNGDGLPLA
jgi:hypothetical protein